MPIATIEDAEIVHKELKTVDGGFVELRVMSYGKWLKRQELALNLTIETTPGSKESKGEMQMANAEVTIFEYKNAIVNHNLTTKDEVPLDFSNVATFDILHPRIGNEISQYITEMHEFMSEASQGN